MTSGYWCVNGVMAAAALQQQLMNAQLNNYLHHVELQEVDADWLQLFRRQQHVHAQERLIDRLITLRCNHPRDHAMMHCCAADVICSHSPISSYCCECQRQPWCVPPYRRRRPNPLLSHRSWLSECACAPTSRQCDVPIQRQPASVSGHSQRLSRERARHSRQQLHAGSTGHSLTAMTSTANNSRPALSTAHSRTSPPAPAPPGVGGVELDQEQDQLSDQTGWSGGMAVKSSSTRASDEHVTSPHASHLSHEPPPPPPPGGGVELDQEQDQLSDETGSSRGRVVKSSSTRASDEHVTSPHSSRLSHEPPPPPPPPGGGTRGAELDQEQDQLSDQTGSSRGMAVKSSSTRASDEHVTSPHASHLSHEPPPPPPPAGDDDERQQQAHLG